MYLIGPSLVGLIIFPRNNRICWVLNYKMSIRIIIIIFWLSLSFHAIYRHHQAELSNAAAGGAAWRSWDSGQSRRARLLGPPFISTSVFRWCFRIGALALYKIADFVVDARACVWVRFSVCLRRIKVPVKCRLGYL